MGSCGDSHPPLSSDTDVAPRTTPPPPCPGRWRRRARPSWRACTRWCPWRGYASSAPRSAAAPRVPTEC
eukprot:scaffold24501_cov84-Isochrysis_galbana.AAC.2